MHQFLHVERDLVITIDGRWHVIAFDAASGDIAWMSRLRSAGNWCPVACGRYLVVLSRGGEIAVFDPARGLKVWEGGVGMRCRQPPGIGIHEGAGLLAAAGNSQGLKLFQIHPEYLA
jgi:hypothetical protein